MADSVNRFSTRVENYAKYRPDYPESVCELLKSECGLTRDSVIADVGSGTGILSQLFLKNGNKVFGVEPNGAMRQAAETFLRGYRQFTSVEGTAEKTTLQLKSVEFVTAAQAFHWFDRVKAKAEFIRILKSGGWVVLIWNDRRLDSTLFLRSYEQLLLRYGTDYRQVRHENVLGEIAEFFAPKGFKLESFENPQEFDFESLKGRLFSSSYTPEPGKPSFEPMLSKLREIFDANAENGRITFEYDTKVYYGHLTGS
jgi:SAM-dependent methyltransferase